LRKNVFETPRHPSTSRYLKIYILVWGGNFRIKKIKGENSKNFIKILQILKFSVTLHRKFHPTTTVVESEIKNRKEFKRNL
jgi:hypothetical protein